LDASVKQTGRTVIIDIRWREIMDAKIFHYLLLL